MLYMRGREGSTENRHSWCGKKRKVEKNGGDIIQRFNVAN